MCAEMRDKLTNFKGCSWGGVTYDHLLAITALVVTMPCYYHFAIPIYPFIS